MRTIVKQIVPVTLSPAELNDVYTHIEKKLFEDQKRSSQKLGYVSDILNIELEEMAIVSRTNGDCTFTVSFEATVIKPEVGDTFSCIISLLFKEGIFADFERIRVLIPATVLEKDWSFLNGMYVSKSTNEVMSKGTWITVRLDSVRYVDNNFQCIGSLA